MMQDDSSDLGVVPGIPQFLIVGAMKAGTTALYDFLRDVESIHVPLKELHFFNHDEEYNKGLEYYRQQLLESWEGDDLSATLVGEKTPTYSYLEKVPSRIRESLPNVKLVWIFRDPVDRAYSHYLHAVRAGVEWRRFESVIEEELAGLERPAFRAYLDRSLYASQVKRYLECFPSGQMHYLRFEELISDPAGVIGRLADFLGVERFEVGELPRSNKSRELHPAWNRLYAFSVKRFGKKHGITRRMVKWGAAQRKQFQLTSSLRAKMRQHFDSDLAELEELTGFDLEDWRPCSENTGSTG